MKELETARKVLNIVKEISTGVETTRSLILEEAGRARSIQIKRDLGTRRQGGAFPDISEQETDLQVDIIASLDQMSRRMPHPLPSSETDRVEDLINKLDKVRGTKELLPISPGLCIWRGSLELRRHDYSQACRQFVQATDILGPMLDDAHYVPATMVAALCEGAYGFAMLGKEKKSIALSEEAILVARKYRTEKAFLFRMLREQYVAGEFVTPPLATAFLTACDIRINLADQWDANSELATHFAVYWNLLNDECGGLSSLEVPYLIAILSDERWMAQRPDLAAPIARALYLKTSASIPQALWRKANLFVGGFRFAESVSSIARSNSLPVMCGFVVLALAGFGGAEALGASLGEIKMLSAADVAGFFDIQDTESPSGTDIVEGLQLEELPSGELGGVAEMLMGELPAHTGLLDAFEVATGSSSLVAAKLV